MTPTEKKEFLKRVLIYTLVLTVALTPVQIGLKKIGGIRLFAGTTILMNNEAMAMDETSPFYDDFKKSKRVNMLVLGVNDGLTDVIMLASYDLRHQRVDVISIPRDTYCDRDGYSGANLKINSIYGSEGVVGVASAVSDTLLGMPVHYYMVIDYDAVRAVVDEMGGVPIYVEQNMKYDDPYDTPPLHIDIRAGEQVLDGDTAVEFLRYRKGYAQGDIGRIGAHQQFISAAFTQALRTGVVDVANVAFKEVESDLPLGKMTKMALKASFLDSEDMQTWLAPGGSGTRNGLSYWFVDEDESEIMIKEIYGIGE